MKAQTKALVASVAVIALALSAVSGITYSWWSDSENSKIDINTGDLDVTTSDYKVTLNESQLASENEVPTHIAMYYGKDGSTTAEAIYIPQTENPDALNLKIAYTVTFTSTVNYTATVDVKGPQGITYTATATKDSDTEAQSLPQAISEGATLDGKKTHTFNVTIQITKMSKNLSGAMMELINTITQGRTITNAGEFKAAIESKMPGISLGANITLNDALLLNDGIARTIDLNGYTLAANGSGSETIQYAGSISYAIEVADGSTLNFIGGSSQNTDITSTTDCLFLVNGGTLNVSGGNFSVKSPLNVFNGGNATFSGSIINNSSWIKVGVGSKGSEGYERNDFLTFTNVTMNTKGDCCIGAFKNCNVTITGGSYTSNYGSAFLTNGSTGRGNQTWNISGATFNVNLDGYNESDKDETLSCAIQCHNTNTWNISDCTFNVKDGVAISVRGGKTTISGCTFDMTSSVTIKAGKLQFTDVCKYIESGHAVAVCLIDGSYGCDSTTSLTFNGVTQSIAHQQNMTETADNHYTITYLGSNSSSSSSSDSPSY